MERVGDASVTEGRAMIAALIRWSPDARDRDALVARSMAMAPRSSIERYVCEDLLRAAGDPVAQEDGLSVML
ncbi:MAG: hypothetical protein R3A52_02395 [Polyangiales bacterium]